MSSRKCYPYAQHCCNGEQLASNPRFGKKKKQSPLPCIVLFIKSIAIDSFAN